MTMRFSLITRRTSPLADNQGFSLIEVIVALAVLTIGILAVNAMQTLSIRGNKTANDITAGTGWSADQVERIILMDYDDLVDTNGNGAGPDVNDNNIDDDDEGMAGDGISNFGLDETANPDAVEANDPDGRYTIVYNVAQNYPMDNIKTVHVIVTWNDGGTTRSVTIHHKKSRFM
ncbi:MAG: hypothetical protein Kow0089_17350 [Desulfobulbaceae bacterium]